LLCLSEQGAQILVGNMRKMATHLVFKVSSVFTLNCSQNLK
jgi:hypothetical protein